MSDDASNDLFQKYFQNGTLAELSTIAHLLPNDLATLRTLASRCRDDERKAARAGRPMEVRRLNHLAGELTQFINNLIKSS